MPTEIRVFRATVRAVSPASWPDPRRFTFNVNATTMEIAVRQIGRSAKREGFSKVLILKVRDRGTLDK